MAVLGEDHRDAVRVASLDYLCVTFGAARLDHGGRPPPGRPPRAVGGGGGGNGGGPGGGEEGGGPLPEGEEGIGGDRGAGKQRGGLIAVGVAALLDREANRVDPAHLAGADPERGAVLGDHDRVGADPPHDGPGEEHVLPLLLGRL